MWRGDHVALQRETLGKVVIFRMALIKGQNNFNYESVAEWNKAFDLIEGEVKRVAQAEKNEQQANLLTRVALILHGTGHYFSTGLDLLAINRRPEPSEFLANHFHPLLGRLLTLPLITIAAVNGHVYAGGMTAAMACDWRIMVADERARWCMNEIELASPVPRAMAVLLGEKWGHANLRDCLLAARKYSPGEAKAVGLVDELVTEPARLLEEAQALALQLAKPAVLHTIVRMIKEEAWPRSTAILRNPDHTDYFSHYRRLKL